MNGNLRAAVPMSDSAAVEGGHELRREIDSIYAGLKANQAVRKSNDVTAVVLKYIPVGSTYDRAEAILRAAGCKVSARPQGKPSDPFQDKVDGRAFLGSFLFGDIGVSLYVQLRPGAPGDYSAVGNVQAEIIKSSS